MGHRMQEFLIVGHAWPVAEPLKRSPIQAAYDKLPYAQSSCVKHQHITTACGLKDPLSM